MKKQVSSEYFIPASLLLCYYYHYCDKQKKRTPFVQVDTSQICAFSKKSSICALIFILTVIRMGQWTSATDSDIGKWCWQEEKEEIIMETNRQKEDNNRCVCVYDDNDIIIIIIIMSII